MVFDFDVSAAFDFTCHNTGRELTVRFNVGSHRPVNGDMIGIYNIAEMSKPGANLKSVKPLACAPVDHQLPDKVREVTFSRKFTPLPLDGLTSNSLTLDSTTRKGPDSQPRENTARGKVARRTGF